MAAIGLRVMRDAVDTALRSAAEVSCSDAETAAANGRLEVDLLRSATSLEVAWFDDATLGRPTRAPHRHDYHELVWVREGAGHHRLDGAVVPLRPHTLTVIGRGQVHVFEDASGFSGAVVRFGDEVVIGDAARRGTAGWLLAGRGGQTVTVPGSDDARLEGVIRALEAEATLPPDRNSADILCHLVTTLLLWIERWYDAGRTERRTMRDADIQLHRRFAAALEADFARHHDAAHYADVLRVPPAALSRALVSATGHATKELVLDRVMLEAARLLRYTDLAVGQIAFAVGFTDQLYFSRAFKRRFGLAPLAYRTTARGLVTA
jgi:AraC family transcriptional activator of pobA